jgi:hydrogenase small subunit
MPSEAAVKAEQTLIHVLWINAGLSCDGDSVALTGATQPSIEEIALGALPGLPQIAVHWPLIDFECGPAGGADDFLEWFFKADRGELEPFVLVVEGSIPNENLHQEGYWCGFGNDPATNQPITTSEWLDRLAPKATAIVAVGTCATYGGIHAMAGNPTGAMGVPDYLGWDWKSKAGIPIVCVPGCPIQGDNLSETLTYLLYMATGQAPMIPLDDALRPQWLFGKTVHEGCDRAGYYEQGDFAETGLDQRSRRLPERRRYMHRMHDAWLPGQVHALHGRATGRENLNDRVGPLRFGDSQSAPHHRKDC